MTRLLLVLSLMVISACAGSSPAGLSTPTSAVTTTDTSTVTTTTTAASPTLPNGSRLFEVNGHRLHVRTLGSHANQPAIVLLSGPTDHWHADSGWFALLQPLLARQFRVHAIDRAGHGFSDIVAGASYASFAEDLALLLPQLEEQPVVVIAFASANLAVMPLLAKTGNTRVRAVLLIDPDALHPALIRFYADQSAPFKDAEQLSAYVSAGKYDARAHGFYDEERAHLAALLPEALQAEMDWPFYEAVAKQRLDRARILARFAETARYDADVSNAAALTWPAAVPVWSYDTDFELSAIESATDPAEKAKLADWRRLGTDWMQNLPGHCRQASASHEHLATVAEADRLLSLIAQLARSPDCPAETR
ncbi:alpha/beta fold hydrolase [Permianibacter sp. IMCC34836]|uniref:alpha/beta fold hydrolase n=1 Tax=Permianibacter fluminis TaxID=2738515 RepID=UPI001554E3FD|nr:alpha/beta hydrolase [Permianibacter fluminis]NQD37521.1 alpha/beta fold hydrolase [Permianibacter fluminis]